MNTQPVAYSYTSKITGAQGFISHYPMPRFIDAEHWDIVPLYATPPQRKPLTNGEIYTAYITATNQTLRAQDEKLALAFARAIEAAHGIKE